MKYFSLFSGIGGFEYGIQRACDKQSAEIEYDRQRGDGVTNEVEYDVLPTSGASPLCNDTEGGELGILNSTASRGQSQDGGEGMEYNKDSSIPPSESRQQVPTCIGYSEIDKYAVQIYEKRGESAGRKKKAGWRIG